MQQPLTHQSERHFRTDHLKTDIKGRAARGGALAVSSQGVKFIVQMGATVVLARLLTPADYGLIGMVAVVIGFVSIFKDMGLSAATIQKQEITPAQISTLFWVNVAVSATVMLVTAALAPVIAWFYKEPRLALITVGYAAGFIIGGLTVQHEALLRRQMRFAAVAVLEITALVAGILAAILLAWKGAGYWALVANQLVLGLVYAIGVWAVCGWWPGRPARGTGVRSMLVFGGNVTGFNVVNYFGGNFDNLLVGRLWGAQTLGFYAKAYQLLLLPIDQINAPVSAVVVPTLSRLTDEPERYGAAYLRILEKLTMMTMPLAAFMIGTSDWLVRFVLGPQWGETARIFMILGFAAFVVPVNNSTGWLFMTQGRTREMLHWGFIDVSMKVISVVAGLPWGAPGVALGIVIRIYIQAPILFWYVGRRGPVRATDFYRAIAPTACAFIATLAALYCVRQVLTNVSPVIGLAASFGVAVSVTLLTLIALPKGRAALHDLKAMLFLLMARRST